MTASPQSRITLAAVALLYYGVLQPSTVSVAVSGAMVMSGYIEEQFGDLSGSTVLELGSGTGLVSLVAARCGSFGLSGVPRLTEIPPQVHQL